MSEYISIHIGQAGIQIGEAVWELYCLEHGIQSDGMIDRDHMSAGNVMNIFSEEENGKKTPRAIYVDLETTLMDTVRRGKHAQLHNPEHLIAGNEGGANNFARGYYTAGRTIIDLAMDRIRKMTDECSNLQAFNIFHSLGGGTGSGFTARLADRLSVEYGNKINKIEFAVYPAPNISPVIVEPYNAVMATHFSMDHFDCSYLLDNAAIHDLCCQKLDIEWPTYTHMNELIAQVVSSLTDYRFESEISHDEIMGNMVPSPRLHFLQTAYAPIISVEKQHRQREEASVKEITEAAFKTDNEMIKLTRYGRNMTPSCLYYKGDLSPRDINEAITHVRATSRTDLKYMLISKNNRPLTVIPGGVIPDVKRTVCRVSNTTAIGEAWERLGHKFDLMYEKHAFVHHYVGDGQDEGEFEQARQDLARLEKDYDSFQE